MRIHLKLLVCFILFIIPFLSKGQSRAQLLERISNLDKARSSNLDSILLLWDEVYDQAIKAGYFDVAEKSFYGKSYHIRRHSPQGAIDHLKTYQSLPFEVSREMEMHILIRMASAMIQLQDHNNAFDALTKADKIFEEEKLENKGGLLLNFGELHYGLGQLDKASEYYQEAYSEFVEYDNPMMAKVVLYYILDIHKEELHREPYLSYFEKFIEVVDSSFLKVSERHQSISILGETPAEEKLSKLELLAQNLKSKGNLYSYFEVAEGIVKNKVELSDGRGALIAAQLYLTEAREADIPVFEYKFMRQISGIQRDQNNFEESLKYFEQAEIIKDSIIGLERQKNLDQLMIEFDTYKKDVEIAEKKAENRFLYSALGIALATIIFVVFGFTQRMKKNRIIRNQERKIQEQKIGQLEMDKKLLSMAAMIEGQEAERIRIAKDLHDGLGGLLATVKLHIGKVQEEIKNLENLKLVDRAQDMMDNACDEVRRISHNLMPPILNSKGLAEAMRNYVANLNETQDIHFQLSIQNFNYRLKDTHELFSYRILQELINNVIKHSDASNCTIQLLDLGENIQLIVEDDGRGIDRNVDHSGLGLKSIESRVEFLHGEIEYDSSAEKGTAVFITIPK